MGITFARLAWTGRDLVDRWARQSPARLAIGVFCAVIALVTLLLFTPLAKAGEGHASFADALFTATSAVCVTGLVTVPTGVYWSTFGQVVILAAIKVGGLGIMTLASIVGLFVSRRLGLTQRLLAAEETRASRLGEVGSLVRAVVISSALIEIALALILLPRFLMLGEPTSSAMWHSAFYAISTFNNAGFIPTAEGLTPYVSDWWVCLPLVVGMFIGALGFPVILNIARHLRGRATITLHSRITIATSLGLLGVAALLLGAFEWNNPDTLGRLDLAGKANAILFAAAMPRSGGLATLETASMHQSSWLVQDALMFVGGGSASTGGGIKVTTLAVMLLAILAEARGDRDVESFRRRIPPDVLRVAVAVAFVGATFVLVTTLALLAITGESLDVVLFETISAFGTCGLSLGLSERLPEAGKYILAALMLASRIGIMTLAAALALRQRRRVIRLPVERPIIG